MPILLNGTFGGAGIFGKPEVHSVLQSLAPRAAQSRTGYRSLWVRIYVPDEIATREQAVHFFEDVLPEAARLVRDRLQRRAPGWPADDLAAELAGLAGRQPGIPEVQRSVTDQGPS